MVGNYPSLTQVIIPFPFETPHSLALTRVNRWAYHNLKTEMIMYKFVYSLLYFYNLLALFDTKSQLINPFGAILSPPKKLSLL